MDGIELPFENVLNYASFAVRIAEADLPRLPQLLRAISPQQVAALQRGVRAVRQRFTCGILVESTVHLAGPVSFPSPLGRRLQPRPGLDLPLRVSPGGECDRTERRLAVNCQHRYGSLAPNELRISPNRTSLAPVLAPVVAAAAASEDALDTVMRILLLRAARRRGAGGALGG